MHSAEPVRVFVEYNYATGDSGPADGRRGTFDSLYPTDKYGTADTIAWRNIHNPIANIEFRPGKKWKLRLSRHGYWLADRRDALYSFTGAVLARNPKATSSDVGSELDFRAIYQHSPQLQLWAGYARFFAGPFIRQSTKGSPINFPNFMWTYSF
jgi:hypothetical protein